MSAAINAMDATATSGNTVRVQWAGTGARMALIRDRQTVDELLRRAGAQLAHQTALRHARLDGARAQLAALSPLATLERGYAIVRRASDGQVVTAPEQAAIGDELEVTVKHGSFGVKRET